MRDDDTFRLVMILGCAGVFPIAFYHRWKAHSSKEKLDRRQEGRFIYYTLRPIGVLSMLGMLAFLINPAWMAWSSVPLPTWLRWMGVSVGVTAAVLAISVYRSLGSNLTDTVVTREKHSLVTRGPYRWVRHPFYVSVALAAIANTIVTANWFLGLTSGITVMLLVVRTRIEERKLVERFGEAYLSYMERTGRFLPRRPRNAFLAAGKERR